MSISIGTNSIYNTAASALDTTNSAGKLESVLKGDLKYSSDDELMDACKNFETYFVEMVLKEVKKTSGASEEESDYMSYFGDILTEEYANQITEKGSLGIAQQLYESMKRNY